MSTTGTLPPGQVGPEPEHGSRWKRFRGSLAKVAALLKQLPESRLAGEAMGIAELVVATAAAVMQAIDTWENFRDRRRAREAYEEELRRAQTSEEVKAEAKQIEDVVPESVLNSIYERINECWTRYDSILRGDFGQEEVDQATRAAIRCWCREVNRIKTVTGKLPDSSGVDFPGKWEQYDCAKRIAAGL